MIRKSIKIGLYIFTASLLAASSQMPEERARPSLADHIKLSRPVRHLDHGWLPDLTGLPNKEEVIRLSEHVENVMLEDHDSKCTALPWNLRLMIFQHFAIYQHMANAQGAYFDEKVAYQWAHVLGMILKESSGDTANISDMTGRMITTYTSFTDLKHWQKILDLSLKTPIKLNVQTNFGLTQLSSDRLFVAFKFAKDLTFDIDFLEGRLGADTPNKIELNTSIAIRRLIWFYQDFAQGRITQSDSRIPEHEITNPAYSDRYLDGIRSALMYCGTVFMYREGNLNKKIADLEKAMASIAYCKLGNSQGGYGFHELDEKCFAQWVTLCPALNIDIAILTPLSYFETRNAKPVCQGTFQRLIINKPSK